MASMTSRIGVVGVVVVAFANVATTWAQSDELPRRLRERISRTLVDGGFPSVAVGFDTEKKITASDGAPGGRFGLSVTISGDTAIVGAWGSGSAYVFERKPIAVPTVAEWGIMAMTLLLSTAMTIKFGWRRRVTR